jgi:neutral ceramidase
MSATRRRIACLILVAAGACLHCSSDESAPVSPSPYDDDTSRLLHCEFEPAPKLPKRAAPSPAPVKAGVASRVLDLPLGSPMGGYGARSTTFGGQGQDIALDTRAPRFATRFVPSAGAHDAPRVDALALEVGSDRLVILQSDSILITETALFAVEKALAPDGSLRGRVIIAASHGHASPSNWLPSFALVPGIDSPHVALFERAVATHAEAGAAALAALEEARVGFAVDLASDTENVVSHDRRVENDSLLGPDGNTAGSDKDHFAWALRVDRADGSPLVGLVSFPIHGTVGTEHNPLFSSEAPGAIERALSHALGYPVFHLQGAGGDVSPGGSQGRSACPDDARCLDMPNLEHIGALARVELAPLLAGIQTEDTLAMEVVTRTVYVGHAGVVTRPDGKKLFYPPPGDYVPDGEIFDADGTLATPLDEFNAAGGAALCGSLGKGALFSMSGVSNPGAYASCEDIAKLGPTVGGLYELSEFVTPVCDTTRATVSAIRFEAPNTPPLLVTTIPGEPTAPYTAYLRGRSPAGPERTLVLGYAQDYIGYVLTAEDWLEGGYEPSLNVWGPLEGEMVLDGILEAAALAWTPELEDPEKDTSRVASFPFPDLPPLTPLATTDHGTVPSSLPSTLFLPDTLVVPTSAQPDATVPRAIGVARFVWLGGDPAVDYPRVQLERETSPGTFEPIAGATSDDGIIVLTYTPDPLDASSPARHFYAASFQPVPPEPFALDQLARPFAHEPGAHRFAVSGRAHTSAGAIPYSLASDPFHVIPAPLAPTSGAFKANGAISIQALLGTAPGLRALGTGPSDVDVPLLGPWSVTVTFDDATTENATVTPSAGSAMLALDPALLTQAVSVDVRDAAGNGGVLPLP